MVLEREGYSGGYPCHSMLHMGHVVVVVAVVLISRGLWAVYHQAEDIKLQRDDFQGLWSCQAPQEVLTHMPDFF